MKRILSLVVALMFLMSSAALAEVDYAQWGANLPLVPESESVTLKVSVPQSGENYDAENVWFWKWAEKAMNINFEVEQVPSASASERLNMMFASDMLPDVAIGFGLSTAQAVKYGVNEQQVLPYSDYMTEELMPNLYAWSQQVSFENVVCSDGKMYVFPYIDRIPFNGGNGHPIYVNQEWMTELGFEMPTTVEELRELLRAFKAADPDCIPMGGSTQSNANYLMTHILNGFGFQTRSGDFYGVDPAYYKDEKLVIPAATAEYKEYLEYMNSLYTEGLISPDFFTMDRTTDFANAAEGKYGMWPYPMNQVSQDLATVQKYFAVPTLLSESNDVYSCPAFSNVRPGNAFISAATEIPEIALKFVDFFYSDLGMVYGWSGPMANTEDTLGMVGGWYVDENGLICYTDVENGKFESDYIYTIACIAPCSGARLNNATFISLDIAQCSRESGIQAFAGVEPQPATRSFDVIGEVGHYTTFVLDTIHYAEKSIDVRYVYFDEDTSTILADLKSVIKSYAETETAKFITGARPLSEFDAYLEEINKLGVEEYLGYYADMVK